MSFLYGMEVAASGLRMQRARMNVISSNLANAETTKTKEGGAYRRRQVIVESAKIDAFNGHLNEAVRGVQIKEVQVDQETPLRTVFDPSHPDANAQGYVEMPNVDVMEEMVDMMMATRGYEANATAFDALKNMAQRALRIGDG